MGKRISEQLGLGGQYTAGDPASAPDGSTKYLQNYLTRPGRLSSRPPFRYDGQMNVNGLANFDDQSSKINRLLAVNTSGQFFAKLAAQRSEGWGATAGTISGHRMSNYANYRGITYMMFDNGSAGLPSGAASFDGTTLSTSPFTAPITSRTVTVFNERLHLSYPRLSFSAQANLGNVSSLYDLTDSLRWNMVNITAQNVTVSGASVCRLYPTSTTASYFWYQRRAVSSSLLGISLLSPSATAQPIRWLSSARCLHATFDMPVTFEIILLVPWLSSTSYTIGDIISDGLGYRHRCTAPGTSGSSAPSWGTTVGSTTSDGGAAWINEGSDVIGSLATTILNATEQPNFTNFSISGSVPPATNYTSATVRMKFFSAATPTITLAPIDVSLRDGRPDGDPKKENYGQQVTLGDTEFPFINQETSLDAVIDMEEEIWSELGRPTVIGAENTYKLREGSGHATAACTIGGRKLTFKRNAFWQFQATGDASIPIRKEVFNDAVGCVGPLALDTFEDVVYFIGENDVYAYSVKDDNPTPICGDGMREVVMAKGDDWVENRPNLQNRPILRIDQTHLIMWVYTQKGKLFQHDLRSKQWATIKVTGDVEIDCMEWNQNTDNFYVAFSSGTYGLTHMDYAASGQDTLDNTATNIPVERIIEFRPLEISDPMRYDAYCEGVQVLYRASGTQAIELAISENQGATYPNTVDYTTVMTSTDENFVPMTLDVCETAPSITLKLTTTGDTGEEAWSLSPRAMTKIEVMKGEYPQVNPTAGAANL